MGPKYRCYMKKCGAYPCKQVIGVYFVVETVWNLLSYIKQLKTMLK